MSFTLGIDFGTNSVRALIVRCADGREAGSAVVQYPSGEKGILLDPRDHNLARQHPADYLFALEKVVRAALSAAEAFESFSAKNVIGIGVDSTGSSPIPVNEQNVPLGVLPEWKNELAAQCWLWKDHTSYREAARITELAAIHRPHLIASCGNTYSSEWFWSKIWHCLISAPGVFETAYSWVELADFIPAILSGISQPLETKRGICAAGHKALYDEEHGGLPDKEFLGLLDVNLAELRDRLYTTAFDVTEVAGFLCPEWSDKLGLPEGIPIAMGEFDVHYGAIGSGVGEGVLVKAIGTSTCDCCVVGLDKAVANIPGICGIVKGSILPGYYGVEAGQSAVGDIFNWWVEVVCRGSDTLHDSLTKEAAEVCPGQSGLLALDWNNGNRTILVDPRLSGLLIGQTLHTTRAEIYRALIEATAFGARVIVERLREYRVPVEKIVCCGGIAEKNPLLMQIYADVIGCTIQVAGSSQACALGAAISAAVLAGLGKGGHADFGAAQRAMTSLKARAYHPIERNQSVYNELYELYLNLHDTFGGVNKSADLCGLMKQVIAIRERQSSVATSA